MPLLNFFEKLLELFKTGVFIFNIWPPKKNFLFNTVWPSEENFLYPPLITNSTSIVAFSKLVISKVWKPLKYTF